MKIKPTYLQNVIFALSLFVGAASQVNANELTRSAGIINGTVPVIYNGLNEPGKVSFNRTTSNAGQGLSVGDIVNLSWTVRDAEGDTDATLPTVTWICTDASHNQRVLATSTNQYTITEADNGCTLGVTITPTTRTGVPRINNTVTIEDISAYDNTDNIPDGPVSPVIVMRGLKITGYIVAPYNSAAKRELPPDEKIHTAFAGAEIQINVDNLSERIMWTTSDKSVATVDGNGLVTIKDKGPFIISAENFDNKAIISFNPEKFFVFNKSVAKNWSDARLWCTTQGDRLPTAADLSAGQGVRKIPGDSLWQEWGNSVDDVSHAGTAFWSSVQAGGNYEFMYTATGLISSGPSHQTEGTACLMPY